MEFSDFLKKGSYKFSPSSSALQEGHSEKKESGCLYEAIEQGDIIRKDMAKEIIQLLSSEKIKLVYINAPSGAGKTRFLKSVRSILEKQVLTYYYECSQATNLDDIILSLFNYLKSVTVKDKEYIKNFKISASFSIDERLINRIKNLKKPLLVIIDGMENLFETADISVKKELLEFLDFISSVPEIKIIAAGEEFQEFETKNQVYTLYLENLKKKEAINIARNAGISAEDSLIEEVLNITKGYPENILMFSALIKSMNTSAGELAEKIKSSGEAFEKAASKKLYGSIPVEYKEIADFFLLVRHSFSADTLKKISFTPDIEEKIAYLESIRILNNNNNAFQIKQKLKNYLAPKILKEEKVKIHSWLYELYSGQISARLENRLLPVSRRVLYSEQYYHYKQLAELGVIPDYKAKTKRREDAESFLAKFKAGSYEVARLPEPDENEDMAGKLDDFAENDDSLEIRLSEEEKGLVEENSQENPTLEGNSLHETRIEPLKSDDSGKQESDSFELMEKELRESLVSSRADSLNHNYNLFKLASLYKEHYRHDQALQGYYSILNSDRTAIPEDILPETLESIGEIYDYRKEFDSSISYFERALVEAEKLGIKEHKARIYFKLALAYDDSGDYDNALNFYQKNLETSGNPDENQFLAAACSNTAAIYDEIGNPAKAVEFYQKSLRIDEQAKNREGEYEVLSKLGDIYLETGNYPEAKKCFYRELHIAKDTGDPYKIAMSYIDIGDIFLVEKSYEKAIKAFILAKKSIDKTISTDSKEKINRRFSRVIDEIGKDYYTELIQKIRSKNA